MRTAILIALLGLGPWSAALAQNVCPASTAALEQVTVGDDVGEFFTGLEVSFLLGLDPASFPRDEIAGQVDPCTRGQLEVDNAAYIAFGAEDGSPPRWAASADADAIAFLALMPAPSVALKWARSRNRSNSLSFTEPPIYALAVTDGDIRKIYALFREVPGDAELILLFQQALNGTIAPFARYDAASGKTEFVTQ